MKNYAAIADLRVKTTFHIEKAFDRGYEQGYNDCKVELTEEEAKVHYNEGYEDGTKARDGERGSIYYGGYGDGYKDGQKDALKAKGETIASEIVACKEAYEKGLKHGQELRAEEVKCVEACGMKRVWEAARKLILSTDIGGLSSTNIHQIFDTSDYLGIFNNYSASEVIEKIEAWEKKQEQTEENCDTCKHGEVYKQGLDITTMDDECGSCCSWNSKWTPKEDTPEMNVESIKVWDEVKDNFGNKLLVTHVYSECRNVDTIDTDGRFERFPSECLKKTGRRYCFQELLNAMKSEKPEEGGENVHE